MLYEAVLMDMDGVIIDTQQSILAFWQRVASEYHIHLTQEDIDQHISGRSAHHTITTLLPPLDEEKELSIFRALHDCIVFEDAVNSSGCREKFPFFFQKRPLKKEGKTVLEKNMC